MRDYTLTHLSDAVLLRDLVTLVSRDRATTATLLAHIAEVDARRLYVPAGYPSMHAYCVDELRLSEDAAYKRITAARAARQFPVLFASLAEGRLHLAAVSLLAPHLTPENAEELIEAATHRRKSEIEEFLALRFTVPELPARARAVSASIPELVQLAPGRVDTESPTSADEHAGGHLGDGQVRAASRFLLQLTITKDARNKLRYAQELLSHAVPNGDTAQVFERALDALITQLEKRKLGATTRRLRRRPVEGNRTTRGGRYVPAQVRRAVWERDQGQCTFVSAAGNRCKARRFLEFDHIDPVARGGRATVDRMRLRCRAHNQYEAERAFGAEFMNGKRHEGRLAKKRVHVRVEVDEQFQDLLAGLRGLGCSAYEARRAAECSRTEGATLEERLRAALKFLPRRSFQGGTSAGGSEHAPPT